MTKLNVQKYTPSAEEPKSGTQTEGVRSFCLSCLLHFSLIALGILIATKTIQNAGSHSDSQTDQPIYISIVKQPTAQNQTPQTHIKGEQPAEIKTPLEPEEITEHTTKNTAALIIKQSEKKKKQQQKQSNPIQITANKNISIVQNFTGGHGSGEIKYTDQIRAIIEANKIYPGSARRRGLEGTAIIQLRVNHSGKILNQHIIRSTGVLILDKAAIEMIEQSKPLPAMPDSIRQQSLSLEIPIEFYLK